MQEEFEAYSKCGRLEHGFLRVRCEDCHAEKLVAFSCKRRGFCPSCGARRMTDSAALLAPPAGAWRGGADGVTRGAGAAASVAVLTVIVSGLVFEDTSDGWCCARPLRTASHAPHGLRRAVEPRV